MIPDPYWRAFALSSAFGRDEAGYEEQDLATLEQVVEVVREINDAEVRAYTVKRFASALAEAGDEEHDPATLEQGMEFFQEIARESRQSCLQDIAMTLATEPLPGRKKIGSRPACQLPPSPMIYWGYKKNGPHLPARRMKQTFTPKEKQLAKQVMEALPGN